VIVCDSNRRQSLAELAPPRSRVVSLEGGDNSLQALCELAASDNDVDQPICQRSGEDLAAIVYTSGTTGRSKGAMLTHANLASNALTLHELWGFREGDVLLHALPIFHVHGLFVALNTAMLNASRIIFLPKFDTREVLARLPQATVMMGVPTFYTRLLGDPDFDQRHYQHMRLFISGSAPLTEQTFHAFEARTGQRILERYGMSETGMITSNPLQGERVAGTVGFALPGVELRLSSAEGTPLPPGQVGIIEVRGPNVFPGYWKMPDKTAEDIRGDGWFITGDMGRLDEHGRLSIVGRQKDLIISGGFNVYPKEVELCLDATGQIAESAVIGVPHPDYGEAVVAVCVAAATSRGTSADALREQVLQQVRQQLAGFKQPKRFIFVEELPRNAMGKVQKKTLREDYNHLFATGI
jgi:malonyl-CoA/methylmalonyl-CoA synthetase